MSIAPTTESPVVDTQTPAITTPSPLDALLNFNSGTTSEPASTPSVVIGAQSTTDAPVVETPVAVANQEVVTPVQSPESSAAIPAEGVVDFNTAMAKINELSAQLNALQAEKAGQAAPAELPTVASYVTQEDIDNGKLSTVEGLNEILHRATQSQVQDTLRKAVPIIQNMTLKTLAEYNMVETFYNANKDLIPHKPYVSAVSQAVINANPGKSLDLLLPEIAKLARTGITSLIKSPPAAVTLPTPINPLTPTQQPPVPLAKAAQQLNDLFEFNIK